MEKVTIKLRCLCEEMKITKNKTKHNKTCWNCKGKGFYEHVYGGNELTKVVKVTISK